MNENIPLFKNANLRFMWSALGEMSETEKIRRFMLAAKHKQTN